MRIGRLATTMPYDCVLMKCGRFVTVASRTGAIQTHTAAPRDRIVAREALLRRGERSGKRDLLRHAVASIDARMLHPFRAAVALVSFGALACSSPRDEPEQRPVASTQPSATPAPTTRPLGVKGASIDVPRAFVALEDDRTEQLRASAVAQEPDSQVTLAAVRDSRGIDEGLAYVMRGDLADKPSLMHGTVRDVLETMGAQMRVQLELSGATIQRFDHRVTDGALEISAAMSMTKGDKTVEVKITAQGFMAENKRVTLLSAACMQAAGKTACEPILAQRHFDHEPRLAESTELGPPVTMPKNFLGFTWGGSTKDFAAACTANHLSAVDPSTEPPAIANLVKRGDLSECRGSITSIFGKVVHVGGQFAGGGLEVLGVDLDESTTAAAAAVDKAWNVPMAMPDGTRIVGPAAQGAQLFAVRVTEPTVGAARASVLLFTRAAWDRGQAHP
jgi:hypothetical protein